MRYIVAKYVDAESAEEARKKSLKLPIHEVYIHNAYWEKDNYGMGKHSDVKIGFKDDGHKKRKKTK